MTGRLIAPLAASRTAPCIPLSPTSVLYVSPSLKSVSSSSCTFPSLPRPLLFDHADAAGTRDVPLAAHVPLVPVGSAIGGLNVAGLAAGVIRLAVYRRTVHQHAGAYLGQPAPLYRLGIHPPAGRFTADGQA